MKKSMKLTIIGIIVALAGAIIAAIGAGLGGASAQLRYEQAVYEQQSANISAVELSVGAGEIKTEFYGGDKILIEYPLSDYLDAGISERDGVLKLDFKTKWWSMFSFYDIPPVTVKLPQTIKYGVKINLAAGTLNIGDGVYGDIGLTMSAGTADLGDIECEKFSLKTSAGTAAFENLKCGSANFNVSAGTVSLTNLVCPDISVGLSAGTFNCSIQGREEDYEIISKVSAGSCTLTPGRGNGSGKSLNVNVSAGSAAIYFTGA